MSSASLIPLNEAAARWGVKHTQVRYLLNRGGGNYDGMWVHQVGGRLYFLASDVERHEKHISNHAG